MESIQGFHGIVNLILMPMWFLSGALFPIAGAARGLGRVDAITLARAGAAVVAAGGGVEYAFTNNLSAKIEGLYVNLDNDDVDHVDHIDPARAEAMLLGPLGGLDAGDVRRLAVGEQARQRGRLQLTPQLGPIPARDR